MSGTIKKIGLLFGMEDAFPSALVDAIAVVGQGEVIADAVEISALRDTQEFDYALILDRISHEVPFYRTFLKVAAARGVQVVNNPFWSAADDKYFGNIVAAAVGVTTPRTVLLPHKQRPPNTEASSFRNLRFVDWDAVFDYLKFPIFLKPAHGGGGKDVYKADSSSSFFAAYDASGELSMMAQAAVDYDSYFRIYTLGRERVRIMRYDPGAPYERRYVRNGPPLEPEQADRLRRDALALSTALGYDLNTVELAVRDGVPYAIDFTNPAPEAEPNSVGEAHFTWIVQNMAEVLVERVQRPRAFELAGTWPAAVAAQRGANR